MRFSLLTIFPDYFDGFFSRGIVSGALKKNLFSKVIYDLREFSTNSYRSVDDIPFGGGDGMVMTVEPLVGALRAVEAREGKKTLRIAFTPQGKILSDALVKELASSHDSFTLVCGRYAGIDERFSANFLDLELSIGDYVVSGGEIPAMVLMDALVRQIPGALGNDKSKVDESFHEGLLEYPQFTRPPEFEGMKVPSVLQEGHHLKIEEFRRLTSLLRTYQRRPDLWAQLKVEEKEIRAANRYLEAMEPETRKNCGLTGEKIPL
jgi:tRNA (guanine37-N1)-methyltransferase